jgi:hypothetical protein
VDWTKRTWVALGWAPSLTKPWARWLRVRRLGFRRCRFRAVVVGDDGSSVVGFEDAPVAMSVEPALRRSVETLDDNFQYSPTTGVRWRMRVTNCVAFHRGKRVLRETNSLGIRLFPVRPRVRLLWVASALLNPRRPAGTPGFFGAARDDNHPHTHWKPMSMWWSRGLR